MYVIHFAHAYVRFNWLLKINDALRAVALPHSGAVSIYQADNDDDDDLNWLIEIGSAVRQTCLVGYPSPPTWR